MDGKEKKGPNDARRRRLGHMRYVFFLMYKILILLLLLRPTKAHSSQRRPTKANAGQRRPTAANAGPRRQKKGLNDASGVVWALGVFFLIFLRFTDNNGPKRRRRVVWAVS